MPISEILSHYGLPLLLLYFVILLFSPFRDQLKSFWWKNNKKATTRRPRSAYIIELLEQERFIAFIVRYKRVDVVPYFKIRRSDNKVEVVKKTANSTYSYFQMSLTEFMDLANTFPPTSSFHLLNQIMRELERKSMVYSYIATQPDVKSVLEEPCMHIF